MIKINNTDISDIKINDTSVSKVMVGSTLVWSAGGPGSLDYVQDGLVFQLDGIDKGNNTGYWTDLVGGIKYDLSDATLVYNDCVYLNNTPLFGDGYLPKPSGLNITTVEFCIKIDDLPNREKMWLLNNNNTYYGIIIDLKENRIIKNIGKYGSPRFTLSNTLPKTMICSIMYNSTGAGIYDKVYINLSQPEHTTGTTNGGDLRNGDSTLGGYTGSSWTFVGKIYAYRAYDRELTDEEIMHNQLLDALRFGINIPTPET